VVSNPSQSASARPESVSDALEAVFGSSRGVERLSGRIEPIPVGGIARVILVLEGSVDVFVVARGAEGGGAGARRLHAVRCGPGAIFDFGMSPGAGGPSFVVVQEPEARAVSVELPDFVKLGSSLQEAWATLIDDWVTVLVEAMKAPLPPLRARALDRGHVRTTTGGDTFCARDSVQWLDSRGGIVKPLGEITEWPSAPESILPLTPRFWAVVENTDALRVRRTVAMLGDESFARTLEQFQTYAARRLSSRLLERSAVDLGSDAAYEDDKLLNVGWLFTRILNPRAPRAYLAPASEADALFNACAKAAVAVGVSLERRPIAEIELLPRGEAVSLILAVAGIRIRKVRLGDDWWRNDAGVLIGFSGERYEPIALVPRSSGRYWAIGAASRRLTVSAREASLIHSEAYALFRPFPDQLRRRSELLRFGLRGQGSVLFRTAMAASLASLVSLLTPAIVSRIVDTVIPSAAFARLMEYSAVLMSAAVVGVMFRLSQGICLARIGGHSNAAVQAAIWDRLLRLPVAFFREYTAGDLASRALGINSINTMITGGVLSAVFSGIFSVLSLLLMFYYQWKLALYGVGATLLAVLVLLALAPQEVRFQRRVADTRGRLAGKLFQLISGIAKIRVANAEKRAFLEWASEFAAQMQQYAFTRVIASFGNVFRTLHASLTTLVLFVFVAWLASGLRVGDFIGFNVAFQQFYVGILGLAGAFTAMLGVIPIYERARPILEAASEVSSGKRFQPGALSGRISVHHVTYKHSAEAPPALEDIDFSLEPGVFVAICGPSGSGKSTLLRLLLGFAQPLRGSIAYDGQILSNLDVEAVRRQIGVVLQDSPLMPGTVYQNIVGNGQHTLAEAWEAARLVGLDEDIASFPMRMQTVVSAGGVSLSAGQRQKLLLAKAFIKRPRIIMLDEATSALDNATQDLVIESLRRLSATRIMIAHRLSTMTHADRILVLDHGRLVQSDTFDQLLDRPGRFRDLATRQLP
jgi:NHLM bacteriocin system ABC transporter ATP-binding protein